jgi:hypothetical protein
MIEVIPPTGTVSDTSSMTTVSPNRFATDCRVITRRASSGVALGGA